MQGYRCKNCHAESITKTTFCPKCQSQTFELFTLPTIGTVYSFTIIRVAPPEYVDFAPYTVALIQLTENLRITAFIQEVVSIGEKVRWKETKNQTFIFEKAV